MIKSKILRFNLSDMTTDCIKKICHNYGIEYKFAMVHLEKGETIEINKDTKEINFIKE